MTEVQLSLQHTLRSGTTSTPCRVLRQGAQMSIAQMKDQLKQLRPPSAARMEEVWKKYRELVQEGATGARQVVVQEADINWKAVVMSLPQPQPSKVLGCGIRKVWLRELECVYEGIYMFHVERLDGSVASFDWRDLYRDAYHSFFDTSFANDVHLALRGAVLSHLMQYKEEQSQLVSAISGKALVWEQAVVQHHPTSFQELVDSFLDHVQLKVQQLKLAYDEKEVYVLRDRKLQEMWVRFHALRAHFRIIALDEVHDKAI